MTTVAYGAAYMRLLHGVLVSSTAYEQGLLNGLSRAGVKLSVR